MLFLDDYEGISVSRVEKRDVTVVPLHVIHWLTHSINCMSDYFTLDY